MTPDIKQICNQVLASKIIYCRCNDPVVGVDFKCSCYALDYDMNGVTAQTLAHETLRLIEKNKILEDVCDHYQNTPMSSTTGIATLQNAVSFPFKEALEKAREVK